MATSKIDRFRKLIEKSGEKGVSFSEAQKAVKTTANGVYGIVYALRNKGMNITNKNDRYFLSVSDPQTSTPRMPKNGKRQYRRSGVFLPGISDKTSTPTKFSPRGPRPLSDFGVMRRFKDPNIRKRLRSMTDEDRKDFFDMMGKAVFYERSAQAMVETANLIEDFKKEVGSEA